MKLLYEQYLLWCNNLNFYEVLVFKILMGKIKDYTIRKNHKNICKIIVIRYLFIEIMFSPEILYFIVKKFWILNASENIEVHIVYECFIGNWLRKIRNLATLIVCYYQINGGSYLKTLTLKNSFWSFIYALSWMIHSTGFVWTPEFSD